MVSTKRKYIDIGVKILLQAATVVVASMLIFIFVFIFQKGISVFFGTPSIDFFAFITGLEWRPDLMIYGVLFIIVNTIVTAFFAMLLVFPIAVLTALFIVKIAPPPIRVFLTGVIDVLAAIPSIVYGVFASGVIVSAINNIALYFGYTSFGGNSMLAVIIVLAMMTLPMMCSLSIVAIQSVSKNLEWASLALGASKTQTNFKIVLRSARSGIFAGLILGLARAFGEATAVSMVAGNKMSGPTWNPFDITRTLTSTMLAGLKETTGLDYDVRFTVGIILLVTILLSNYAIHKIKQRMEY